MLNVFSHFNPYSDDELINFWKSGTIILDSSALFRGLYESNESVREKWISILGILKQENRIWMPFQVGLEFHKNRPRVFRDVSEHKAMLRTQLADTRNALETHLKEQGWRHSTSELNEIKNTIKYLSKKISAIEVQDKNSLKLSNDHVYNRISEIYDNAIGNEPERTELESLSEIFSQRFLDGLPPGLSDEAKADERKHLQFNHPPKHGDQYIWHQIIEYANSTNNEAPIVFVTDDCKEDGDWFWYTSKKGSNIIGTHPYLRKEFKEKTGRNIYICRSLQCLKSLSELFGIEAPDTKPDIQSPSCYKESIPNCYYDYEKVIPLFRSVNNQNSRSDKPRYPGFNHQEPATIGNKLTDLQAEKQALSARISRQKEKIESILLYLGDTEDKHDFEMMSEIFEQENLELAYLKAQYDTVSKDYFRLIRHTDF